MRDSDGQVIRLADYRAPDFLIDHVDLDFDLDPRQTRVVAELKMRRNPAAAGAAQLVLMGDELSLRALAMDGRALGPEAYEALTGIKSYLSSFGAENPISVRLHTIEKSKGALYDRLEREMRVMEREGNSQFVPLAKSLANPENGCISVGINEAGSSDCTAFSVRS